MERLQFITHQTARLGYFDGARAALQGGCRWIQLRMKGATDAEVEQVARPLMDECRRRGATFIIDDRVELVLRLGADGVHLGKSDMPVSEARRRLGERAVIGGTANTIDDVRRLAAEGADYIGCGPFRFTTTKERLAPTLGLDGYRLITQAMRTGGITLPIVAIGGITLSDVPAIMAAGVDGVAVSGCILTANNPENMTRQFVTALNAATTDR